MLFYSFCSTSSFFYISSTCFCRINKSNYEATDEMRLISCLSSSRSSNTKNTITATTSFLARIGIASPALNPISRATCAPMKFVSWATSFTHSGCFDDQTRPGSPAPFGSVSPILERVNFSKPSTVLYHAAFRTRYVPVESGIHISPKFQPERFYTSHPRLKTGE